MKINDVIEVEFNDLDYNLNGVGKFKDYIVFSRFALPNEIWEVQIDKINKNIIYGTSLNPIKLSKERKKSECDFFPLCGGCDIHHLDYDNQIKYKRKALIETLKKVGNIDFDNIDIIKADNIYNYRNKVQMPYKDYIYGFYELNSNKIVPINKCLIHNKINDSIFLEISDLLKTYKLDLRHVVIRNSYYYDETMIIFVLRKENKNINYFKDLLINKFNITSLIININDKDTNVILGDKELVIYGNGYIKDKILGNDYIISPKSFFQINNRQTEKLYQKAIDLANINKEDVVIDAYCGIGSITLSLSKYSKEVIGIEIVKDAIINANINKELNNIENVKFILGKSEIEIPKILNTNKIDILFVDPPRKGLDKSLVDCINNSFIDKIIYISCNPASLARDLKLLSNKYNIENIIGVDMFIHTKHVETVTLLSHTKK